MNLFQNHTPQEFLRLSLERFRHQAENVPVYKDFIGQLKLNPHKISRLEEIPFLPVEMFKRHEVLESGLKPVHCFESSGTTGMDTSRHYIADLKLYEASCLAGFRFFYGDPGEYCILALLPSYLERENSSLVYMARFLMEVSGHRLNGFYLNGHELLLKRLSELHTSGQKALLLGVSFALLDLAERIQAGFPGLTLMETGGMKGRRPEILREELHDILSQAFGVQDIHSEYGMTELLSQAYAKRKGLFRTPPWMKVLIRNPYDPFSYLSAGQTGLINVIDLANVHTCSFIATSDLGKVHPDGSFEVSGRSDHSDLRGCNLLVS
jgi:phenylacetate-coenzyme A ligase PaaK-like adenylate-forming protein